MNPYQASASNVLVLANASTLIARVVQNIAGNDISYRLNGENITTEALVAFSNQYMHKILNSKLEDVRAQ